MNDTLWESRFRDLETRYRRLRLWAVLVPSLFAAACLATAFQGGRVVRAESFEVVDSTGKVRGFLGMTEGTPALVLATDEVFVGLCAGGGFRSYQSGWTTFRLGGGKAESKFIPSVLEPETPGLASMLFMASLPSGDVASTELLIEEQASRISMERPYSDIVFGNGEDEGSTEEESGVNAFLHMMAEDPQGSLGAVTLGATDRLATISACLEDSDMDPSIEIGCEEEGAHLDMQMREAGEPRVEIDLREEGPAIVLTGPEGEEKSLRP